LNDICERRPFDFWFIAGAIEMTNKNTILYFDLENTLIEHWTDQRLCWQNNNRSIFDYHNHSKIGIFSFALWCDENIQTFINDGMMGMIQDEYGIEIDVDEIIHVNDMIEAYNTISGTTTEHPGSNNKVMYFEAWLDVNLPRLDEYEHIALVDDTAEECMMSYGPENKHVVHYRNPTVI